MNSTMTQTREPVSPILMDYLERVLLLACSAKAGARNDQQLLDAMNAIENASRVAILEHMESIAPEYPDNASEADIPF